MDEASIVKTLQNVMMVPVKALVATLAANFHARSTAIELAYLDLAHSLDKNGALPLADTIDGLDATASRLPDGITHREDIQSHMARLSEMLKGQVPAKDQTQDEASQRRDLFRVIEGGIPTPPTEN